MEMNLNKKLKFDIVLADADDTLFDFRYSEERAFKSTMKYYNVDYSDETYKMYSEINLSYWKKLERGEITKEQLKRLRYQDLFDRIGVKGIDTYEVNEMFLSNLSKESKLIDGAFDFVKKLHQYTKIYIITNGLIKAQTGRLKSSGLEEYVDGMFISEAIGYSKPSVEYFNYVFDKIDLVDKERIIVLGDSLTSDIQGGKNAGIATCKFNRDGINVDSDLCDYQINSYDEFFDIIFS